MSSNGGGLASLIELARRLDRVQSDVRALSLPTLSYSSLEDGAIPEFDAAGTQVAQYGTQFDGSHMAAPLVGPTPPVPSAPTAVAVPGGGVQVTWDGLWADPAAIVPMDFSRVEVHVSPVVGFDPATAIWLRGTIETPRGGQLVVSPLIFVQHEVRLVARSLTGARSAASAAVLVTPSKIAAVDLATGAVGFDQIAFKQPGNTIPDGTFEDATYRTDVTSGLGTGWAFTNAAGAAYAGQWALQATGASGGGTTRTANLLGSRGIAIPATTLTGFRVQPGERWMGRFRAKASTVGTSGFVAISLAFYDVAGGLVTTSDIKAASLTALTGAYAGFSGALTVPAAAAYAVPLMTLGVASDGVVQVDDVELRPIIGTVLIDDAAITTAQIANLAVSDAKIGSVSAAKITTGELQAGQKVSAGPLAGTHAEMSSDGFRVFSEDPVDGIPNEVVRMGTADDDFFAVFDATGLPVASVSETGGASFTALDVADEQTLSLGGNPFIGSQGGSDQWDDVLYTSAYRDFGQYPLGYMERFPRGPVAYAEITTASLNAVNGSSEVGWFELRATLKPNRHYAFRMSPVTCQYVNTGSCTYGLVARYTSNGTSPTLSSADLSRSLFTAPVSSGGFWTTFQIPYRPIRSGTVDVDFRVLVSLFAGSTANTSITPLTSQGLYAVIEDLGPVMDSGAVIRNITSTSATPPAAPKQYTKTYLASSSSSYRSDGTKRTDTDDLVQGYSAFNGDGQAVVCVPSMTADLAGATVQKIEVYAYAYHWYYNSGGTALIKVHGYSSPPASSPSQTTAVTSSGWPKPGGRWVTLPASLYAGFKSGTYKGFGFGPAGSSNLLYYGRFSGAGHTYPPRIRVTYTK